MMAIDTSRIECHVEDKQLSECELVATGFVVGNQDDAQQRAISALEHAAVTHIGCSHLCG